MIDFRYHLVSLISVFMALAVGVVLGAGPLRDAIGSQLDEQVSTLRDQRNELRDELDEVSRLLEFDSEYLLALAPDVLEGQLEGKGVAIVNLDGSSLIAEGLITGLEGAIEQADGYVTNVVHLEDIWVDPEQEGARSATAERLGEEIDGWVASDLPEEVLGRALSQALTQVNMFESTSRSEQAYVLEQVLVDAGFVDFTRDDDRPADIILTITGRGAYSNDVDPDVADPQGELTQAHFYTVRGLSSGSPTVVAGPPNRGEDLISRVINEQLSQTATYAGVGRTTGMVAVPLVIANADQGEFGNYGQGEHASAPIPPRVEIQVEELPQDPDPDPNGGPDTNGLSDDAGEEEEGNDE